MAKTFFRTISQPRPRLAALSTPRSVPRPRLLIKRPEVKVTKIRS
jgi:hypothetical protein